MIPDPHPVNGDPAGEIAALVATLRQTERRLEEVTRGEVDTVADGSGRPFLLRRAQDELRHSEADKQAAILNSLPANIALLDAQGVIVSVNETWRHFAKANLLVGPEFGIGINYLEVCDRARGDESAQAKHAAAGIRTVLAGAKNFSLEYPCHSPREQRWFQMLVTPLSRLGARGAIVMHLNITERKRTEARLRRLVDSDAQPVIFWNTRGAVTDANQAFLKLTGYSREDLQRGRINWAEMTPPEFAPRDQKALAELAATGVCATYEKEWIRRDGSRVPVLVGAAIFEDNSDEGLCFVLDLTQRNKADEKLRDSEKRFKALFEQAAVGVALAEVATGRIVQVNQRFADIVGRSRGELEQLTFAEITHPHHADTDLEMMRRLRIGNFREANWEKRYVRKDGTEVWANKTVSAMWAPGETPSLCIAIVQDVTERKQMEEQIRQVQKMDAIGTLAGGIAHDFNNILAAIGGYTELAQMTLIGNYGVREHLESVLQAVKRAAELVRQILTFSRQQPLERKPIHLQNLVQETFHLLRATIPASIEFDLSLAADAPQVLADETQVHQIMMNLGTNAWHAMKDRNGRLAVCLERVVVDDALAAKQPRLHPGLYARLSVRDTGTGMDPITLSRIFDPFFTTKGPGEGTGLGLSVVHGIMDNHYGAITVESKLGVGTVFHVYFPAHLGEVPKTAAETATIPRGRGERVLVVDDEEVLALMVQQSLSTLGYDAEYATDPAVALAMVCADVQRFDLVLTDLTMPGMTGLLLAAQLRQVRPDLPVILLTGYSATLTAAYVKTQGLQDLLQKPTSIQSLGIAVHAALSTPPNPSKWPAFS